MSPRFDYTAMGFITFDALCRPVTQIPPAGDTYFVEELTLAVSGAAGSAVIVAAKHGLKCQAVGGVGYDDMGDWVLMKLAKFGIDTELMLRCDGFSTSSSLVTTRPDGQTASAPPCTSAALRTGFSSTTARLTACWIPGSCMWAAWA